MPNNDSSETSSGSSITAHHIRVQKTARYYSLGTLSAATREIWFVIHGYGQLAEYFLRHFCTLDNGTRFFVAPEALSRFYVKEWTRVGAVWTTKEDRDAEVSDYVAYLQQLEHVILRQIHEKGLKREEMRIWSLGFSQGVTTLLRWIVRGGFRPDRVICWAGDIPAEIDICHYKDLFERMNATFVIGSHDEFLTPERLNRHHDLLAQAGAHLPCIRFDGGHVMDTNVLHRVVQELSQEAILY
ncbi:MAG: phospholipase [Bacteroidota bacterium]|nr:phospholipase [Candidatus Kapabacteria bacterium]MDW8219057.1 phospholipase [Bacteroidota bacterium]